MPWKRKIAWTLAALAALFVLVVVGGLLYIRTDNFRQFAMREIVKQADQATGGHAQIGALDLNLSTLTARLHNVVVHGTEPADAPPLLKLDTLTVQMKVRSVIKREVNLAQLLIDHPVVNVRVDKKGNNNFPQAPPSNSHTDIFQLAVGRTEITNGEINYLDRKTPLDADLYDLSTDITFDSTDRSYRGTLSYSNGRLHYGEYAPMPHSFNAKFSLAPSLFSLESATLKVAASSLVLHANVTNFSNPAADGNFDILLHTPDFASMSPGTKPVGDVSLSGKLHYQSSNSQPLLRSVTMDGQFGSDALSAVLSGRRMEARKLGGKYQFANGVLRVSDAQVESLGGRINADLTMRNLDATPATQLRATLRSISLQALQHTARQPELNRVALLGTLDGAVQASWTGSVSNIRAQSDFTIRSGNLKSNPSSTTIPVNGTIHANYDGPKDLIGLRQTNLRIPSATLTADGEISNRSNLAIHTEANDLNQLVKLVSAVHPMSNPPALSGSATVDATVRGSMQKPHVTGQIKAQNLHVQGSEWKTAQLSVQADPSRIVVTNGHLENAKRGQASFDANVALHEWSYVQSDPIQANLSISQMSISDLEHLANATYPVSGELSANVSLRGSQMAPQGFGSVQISNARAYDQPVRNLNVKFHAENDTVSSTLNLVTDAGSANADLAYTPKTKAYKLRLDAPAIVLQKLEAVQAKNLGVNGTLRVSASGQGTVDDPQLAARVELPKLDVQKQSITGITADLQVANKQANFELNSQITQTAVRAHGRMNLTGDYETDASLDSGVVPLNLLLATYAGSVPDGFQGQTEFHATVKGPLKDKTRLEAHLTIPTLKASYQSLEIGAAAPIRADYSDSVVTLQPAELRGTGTSIRIQGSVPLAGNGTPNLTAQGSIDARIARIVSPDLRSSGTLALDIRATGTGANPQLQGQVQLQNLAFATANAPIGVDKLNGTLQVESNRVQISNVTAEVSGGQVTVGGAINYRPSVHFDVAVRANSVRLRYPQGLRSELTSNLAWSGNMQSSSLTGRVLVSSLSFTPDFDLSNFGDQFTNNAAVLAQPGFADTINLRLAVQSKGNLRATSSQVSLEGTADLNVIGTAANPVITGRTDLTAGELFYRNVRYQLQRGIITFDDPNQTNPTLNVSVTTQIEQYNLTLNLRGPFDKLTTAYSSDPPLATADIINLIARGKTSSELAASSQSTDSMVASQAVSQVSGGLQKLAGISSLQIDPLLGGNNQNPGARIALQQRVTKNFLFTFSTDVSQPGSELVQGDYQINKRWSVSVERDQLGGVSVDGRYHTRF